MSHQFSPFTLDAHTKVNLGLRILGRREDGYHELDTVFLELDWGDTLHFAPSDKFRFATTGLNFDDGGRNICHTAYEQFKAVAGVDIPVTIALDKVVPPGSGLGGGSADAAAVLKGLNQILPDPLDQDILESIAVQLGADVPFFLRGGLQHGTGIGEKMQSKELGFDGVILLVIPPIHISTKQAFDALKIPLTAHRDPFTFGRLLDKATLVRFFENEFESVVFHMHPEIGTLKNKLLKQGAYYASLSGSGSTVYGIFDSLETARAAESFFSDRYHTQTTHPRIS